MKIMEKRGVIYYFGTFFTQKLKIHPEYSRY